MLRLLYYITEEAKVNVPLSYPRNMLLLQKSTLTVHGYFTTRPDIGSLVNALSKGDVFGLYLLSESSHCRYDVKLPPPTSKKLNPYVGIPESGNSSIPDLDPTVPGREISSSASSGTSLSKPPQIVTRNMTC